MVNRFVCTLSVQLHESVVVARKYDREVTAVDEY
jgi:hypothetical protein